MRVAVIPARGGSKRIPRKNIRPFGGKPMLAHGLTTALQSGLFDRVVVSTDDAEIAEIARQWGAETPFVRPAELANDMAGTVPVIAHAVDWMVSAGWAPTAVCCIYATAPFLVADDLIQAATLLDGGRWDYVFAATNYGFPIQRALRRNDDGGMPMAHPEHFQTRSQDLEEMFHDAGQFYWAAPHTWKGDGPIFSSRSTAVLLPRWRVQDIDTEEDWRRAELMWTALQQAGQG